MEGGFVEAKSDNLPIVDPFMISVFFMDNMNYLSAEIKSVKNVRATRDSYGDQAVGYVQLKREDNVCIVKGKVTPEHKVRTQAYNVTITIDEEDTKIISSECHDCVASSGGCKHAIAFLYWMLRRSDEPSSTSIECYWKKSVLAKVGTTIKILKASDLKVGDAVSEMCENQSFLDKVVKKAKEQNCDGNLLKYFASETSVKKLSIHHLGLNYFKNVNNSDATTNASNFIVYCATQMSDELCTAIANETVNQHKSSLWYELRYGRITASKIYEASVCSILHGSLFEQILGASSLPDTEAMKRGRDLEGRVLQVVAQKKNIKLSKIGLVLNNHYPVLGSSPDAISQDFVIEVKCPSTDKNVTNYLSKGNIKKKYLSQIQLQMLFCEKQRGLFCVASPDFELTQSVTILEVKLDKIFIENVISGAIKFWENAIFPNLVKS